jgi:hypothetical protein
LFFIISLLLLAKALPSCLEKTSAKTTPPPIQQFSLH